MIRPDHVNRVVLFALCVGWSGLAAAHTRITTDVTWSEHIRDILREKCMVCHHSGGLAPDYVDLTFYGTDTQPGARAWAAAIEEEVLTGRMPPWKPDSRFSVFSNSKQLTKDELNLIVNWVQGGAPQGPLQNLPVPPEYARRDWRYGLPTLVFELPEPHVLKPNVIHDATVAVFPVQLEKDTYITSIEFFPDNPEVIFRIEAWLHDPEGVEIPPIEVEVQTEYDPYAPEDQPEPTRMRPMPQGPHFIGQWVRGDSPIIFPLDAGRLIRAGATLELKIEYWRPAFADPSEEIHDRSRVGLHLAGPTEEIDLLVESLKVANESFVVKAGEANQEVRAGHVFEENVHLIGLNPEAGLLAKDLRVNIHYPDGFSSTLLWIPRFERQWISTYRFDKPIPAPAGARLELIAHYDNTENNSNNPNYPPKDVPAGPGPLEERLYAMVDYLLDDHLKLERKIVPKESPQQGSGMLGIRDIADLFDPTASVPAQPDPKELPPAVTAAQPEAEALGPRHGGEKLHVARNAFHRLEGTMPKPGEFRLYFYDDRVMPIDPRNFSGKLLLKGEGGESVEVPLHYWTPGDEFLSGFVSPTLPQSLSVEVWLGGKLERFDFQFTQLTVEPPSGTSPAFVDETPRRGGWIFASANGYHRVEGTLHEPGDFKLYFYDDAMQPLAPRHFAGYVTVRAENPKEAEKPVPLVLRHPRDEFLAAALPKRFPIAFTATVWLGGREEPFDFEFDEATMPPWDSFGGPELKPLYVGRHGSTQVFQASNGFHFVEGAVNRPGEFRLYVYDDWKNPVDGRNVVGAVDFLDPETGNILRGRVPLEPGQGGHLAAYFEPQFPVAVAVDVAFAGKNERFQFRFDDVTLDPTTQLDTSLSHMDHTPLHGGWQFFMVDNMYHHLEGTMPEPGHFKLYFYDDFKQPLDPRNFAGEVVIESENKESGELVVEKFPLIYENAGDEHLTARLPRRFPIEFFANVEIAGVPKRFDFVFEEPTVEPSPLDIMVASQPRTPGAPHPHILPRQVVPTTIEGILAAIDERAGLLARMINAKDWYNLYIPSFQTKELVAALETHEQVLNSRERVTFRQAIREVNQAANNIDNAGDTNDMPRLKEAHQSFLGGIQKVKSVFTGKTAPGA